MKLLFALAAAFVCSATQAQHVRLDFEEFPNEQELQGVGDLLISKGYVLRYTAGTDDPYVVGFQSVGKTWRFNGRSTAMVFAMCGSAATLTAIDNNPFDLQSIDLAPTNGDNGVWVNFVGKTVDGLDVTARAELRPNRSWQRFRFPPSFNRVTSVTWKQIDCVTELLPHMFDNIDIRGWKR